METTRPGPSPAPGSAKPGASGSGKAPDGPAAAPRTAVLRNPRSHRNRVATRPEPDPPGISIAAPPNREELAATLARFAEEGIELLVIDGGDGTMREVMTAGAPIFGDDWPRLLLLPKGKTNALAIDLGMPEKWSLAAALRTVPDARLHRRRPILVERVDAQEPQVLGFIFGAGVFNAAIAAGQVAHRLGAFQGFAVAVTALFGVMQALFGIGRSPWRALTPMRIAPEGAGEVPHSRHGTPRRRFAVGCSTLGKFPLAMDPFAGGGGGGGIRFLAVDAPLRRVMALVPAILMGLDRPFLRKLGVHRGSAEWIDIELDGPFILDGEAFPGGRYRLRQGPELPFLVP